MITREDLLECVAHARANDSFENKAAQRAEIAAQVDAYLASGGRIEAAVSPQLRCISASDKDAGTTVRRWEVDTRRATERGQGTTSNKKYRGRFSEILLPGSRTSARA